LHININFGLLKTSFKAYLSIEFPEYISNKKILIDSEDYSEIKKLMEGLLTEKIYMPEDFNKLDIFSKIREAYEISGHKYDITIAPLLELWGFTEEGMEQAQLKLPTKEKIEYPHKNLEIILIDDGATDSSGKLCDELAKIDNRIKVYHKENGGLSDARNYGVERATGDYIGFVDSDDYIDSEMYEKLYEAIKKEDVDVAECNFRFIYSNRITNYTDDKYYLVLNKDEYTKEYVTMNRIFGAAWTKLIKSSLAKEIKFPKGKLFEDGFYSLELMKKARNFVIFDSPYYNYVMRENSITNSKFNEKNLYALFFFLIYPF